MESGKGGGDEGDIGKRITKKIGKTPLVNILSGLYPTTSSDVATNGQSAWVTQSLILPVLTSPPLDLLATTSLSPSLPHSRLSFRFPS